MLKDNENETFDITNKKYNELLPLFFGFAEEELETKKILTKCYSNNEFEDLISQTDEFLSENNIKGFITNLAEIDRILADEPHFFSFFIISHLSLRLSDFAKPENSGSQQFFLVSDILLNLTAYNTDIDIGYSAKTYVDQHLITSLIYKKQYPQQANKDFFSSHLENYLQTNSLLYIKTITPVLYNIASQINLKSCIDISIVPRFFDLFFEHRTEIGYYVTFLLISFFKETKYTENEIVTSLLRACLEFIPLTTCDSSMNLAFCLYYFARASPFSLLLSNEMFGDLINQMLKMEDPTYIEIAYSILSFAVTQEQNQVDDVLLSFFDNFDFELTLQHMDSLDPAIANYATICLLNVCTISESVINRCISTNIISLLYSLAKEGGSYDLKINAAIFICICLTLNWELHNFFIENEETFDTLCDLGTTTELVNLMIPAIGQILYEHPNVIEEIANSDLPDSFENLEGVELSQETQEKIDFILEKMKEYQEQ